MEGAQTGPAFHRGPWWVRREQCGKRLSRERLTYGNGADHQQSDSTAVAPINEALDCMKRPQGGATHLPVVCPWSVRGLSICSSRPEICWCSGASAAVPVSRLWSLARGRAHVNQQGSLVRVTRLPTYLGAPVFPVEVCTVL